MARTLRILDADPESRPKVRTSDFVGRFRAGMQLNNRPMALKAWRITTGDPALADQVAGMYGGEAEEWETTKEDRLQVLTEKDTIQVVVEGPDAVTFRMALYGMQGKPTHVCDGVEFIDSEDPRFGNACGCPQTLAERKAAAKAGYGPKPDQRIVFRLADAEELGQFRLMTGSWEFMKSIEKVWSDLEAVGGRALCSLKLELVEFTTKSGIEVSYRKPVLQVHGPSKTLGDQVASLANVQPDEDLPF